MAGAFFCGIALGLSPPVAQHATSRFFLVAGFFTAGSFVFAGILLTTICPLVLSAAASVFAWMLLGLVRACVPEQPVPHHRILHLVSACRAELQSPLTSH